MPTTSLSIGSNIAVQELHWGMGRTDNAWTVNGWAVFMTVDDKARFSGVEEESQHLPLHVGAGETFTRSM